MGQPKIIRPTKGRADEQTLLHNQDLRRKKSLYSIKSRQINIKLLHVLNFQAFDESLCFFFPYYNLRAPRVHFRIETKFMNEVDERLKHFSFVIETSML